MIPVRDLIQWAKDHAIGQSTDTFHEGWVSSDDLIKLAQEFKKNDPLPFQYTKDYRVNPISPHDRLINTNGLNETIINAEETEKLAVPALRKILTIVEDRNRAVIEKMKQNYDLRKDNK